MRRQVRALALNGLQHDQRDVLARELALHRVEIVPGHLLAPGQERLEARGELGVAVDRERTQRQPVKTVLRRDHPRPPRRRAPQLDRRLDSLGARAREKHLAQARRGAREQRLRQQPGQRRDAELDRVRHLELHRLHQGRSHPRVVPPHVEHPEAAQQIEKAIPVDVVEMRTRRALPLTVEPDRPQDLHELRVDARGVGVEILAGARGEQLPDVHAVTIAAGTSRRQPAPRETRNPVGSARTDLRPPPRRSASDRRRPRAGGRSCRPRRGQAHARRSQRHRDRTSPRARRPREPSRCLSPPRRTASSGPAGRKAAGRASAVGPSTTVSRAFVRVSSSMPAAAASSRGRDGSRLWFPTACPSVTTRRVSSGCRSTSSPTWKNVPQALCRASASSTCGVCTGCGPSSNVRYDAFALIRQSRTTVATCALQGTR